MLPSDLIAPKNDANNAIYWQKISLLKTLLAETFPLFPCLPVYTLDIAKKMHILALNYLNTPY